MSGYFDNVKSYIEKKNKDRKYPQWFIDMVAPEYREAVEHGALIKSSSRIDFICPEHGRFTKKVGHVIKMATGEMMQGCPKCGRVRATTIANKVMVSKRREHWGHVPQWFLDELAYQEDKDRAIELKATDEVAFNCEKHGVYYQLVGNKIKIETGERRSGCPMCVTGNYRSKFEDEIAEFLNGMGVSYERNVKGYIKDGNLKYEIDLYVPSRNIGIECNGSYWHSDSSKTPRTKDYHQKKFMIAEKSGIHLINLFDVDWIRSRDKIKDYLRTLITDNTRIYARDTLVARISFTDAKDFCDKYHLQGMSSQGTICYGLYVDQVLVSVMTFGKGRFGSAEYELYRYCVKTGVIIVGGANKLMTAFERDMKPKEIISYSDNDFFTGGIYPRLGFTFDGYTDPDYYWVNSKYEVYKRQEVAPFRLKEDFPELYEEAKNKGVSVEEHIMRERKYFRVYRSGNRRWKKVIEW